MSYTQPEVAAATGGLAKHRAGHVGEVGAALVVVGLSAERVDKESRRRHDISESRTDRVRRFARSLRFPDSVARP